MAVNLYAWEYLDGGWVRGYTGDGFSRSALAVIFSVESLQVYWASDSRVYVGHEDTTYLLWGWNSRFSKYHKVAGVWKSPKHKGYSTPRQYIEARLKAEAVAQEYGAG